MQNMAQMVVYDTKGRAYNAFYQEEAEGWLRISQPAFHDQYVIILKLQDSGTKAGRFLHATRFEYIRGRLVREMDLTPGASEVISIVAVDHKRQRLYYSATGVDEPSQRNLYSVSLDGNTQPECISCKVLTPEGEFLGGRTRGSGCVRLLRVIRA